MDTEEYWKSADELIERLVEIRSKGGNYLLNIGPDGSGEVPGLALSRMKELSQWMAVNAEAVHGTSPADQTIYDGYVSQKDDCIYLFVKDKKQKNLLLYINPEAVESVSLLTARGEKALNYHTTYGNGISIQLPSKMPSRSLSVIKVKKNDLREKILEITD